MASVRWFHDDTIQIDKSFVKICDQCYSQSRVKTTAAVAIQRVFRGYLVRKMIKNWHRAATVIQRYYRGWITRYKFPDVLYEYYDRKSFEYYNKQASKIQAYWRGYMERKRHDSTRQTLQLKRSSQKANSEIVKSLKQMEKDREENVTKEHMAKVLDAIFDRHHLLGTDQKNGVLLDPENPSNLARVIRCTEWTDYMKELREIYTDNVSDEFLCAVPETSTTPKSKLEEEPKRLNFSKYDRGPDPQGFRSAGPYVKPITRILRQFDSSKNLTKDGFKLESLRKDETVPPEDVPPYYIDFWYDKCKIHNLK